MEEQIRTPERELSNEERDNLPGAKFKTLVIRMLTELIELSHKMKEEMKAAHSEIKENIQETNSEGKETRTQINNLEQKEINTQQEQNEEIRIQKSEASAGGLVVPHSSKINWEEQLGSKTNYATQGSKSRK